MMRVSLAAVAVVAGLAGVARADGHERAEAMEAAKDQLDYFAKKCGGHARLVVDWPTFEGRFDGEHPESSAVSWCGDIINTLGWLCDNDESIKPVAQRVRTIRCALDPAVGRDVAFDLRDGTLMARFSWNMTNMDDKLKAWVQQLPADGATADAPGSKPGLNVKQARERKAAQPAVDAAAAELKAACGADIPVTVDWDSFDPSYRGGGYNEESAAGYCKGLVEQIDRLCKRRAEEKRTVAHEIHALTCRYSAAAGPKYTYALQSGAFTASYGWDSGDDGESLLRWLWNTLD